MDRISCCALNPAYGAAPTAKNDILQMFIPQKTEHIYSIFKNNTDFALATAPNQPMQGNLRKFAAPSLGTIPQKASTEPYHQLQACAS